MNTLYTKMISFLKLSGGTVASRALFFSGFWLSLSWLALQISDYDFVAAIHWSETDAALGRYWSLACLEAFAFSLFLLYRTDKAKIFKAVLTFYLVGCLGTFCAYWLVIPDCFRFPNSCDYHLKLYYVTVYVS